VEDLDLLSFGSFQGCPPILTVNTILREDQWRAGIPPKEKFWQRHHSFSINACLALCVAPEMWAQTSQILSMLLYN
jgi:hypothetical protein